MNKSRIFIASSTRSLTLAEKLQDELRTDFSDALLWTEEGRRQPGATIIEMLKSAADTYDFAVVILSKDDLVSRKGSEGSDEEKAKARDNCVFEAGLFMASLGKDRCFLVNGVSNTDLPSDLGGIISIPFTEPNDLLSREECAQAIRGASFSVKETVQKLGQLPSRRSVPLLSIGEVISREKPENNGGDLEFDSLVIVCDLQPMAFPALAEQVRSNLEYGINYLYMLHGTDDTIYKICQSLQEVLVKVDKDTNQREAFAARLNAIKGQPTPALKRLLQLRDTGSLKIALLPSEPRFRFRLHNARDFEQAELYMKYETEGFVSWAKGAGARAMTDEVRRWLPDDYEGRIFLSLKGLEPSSAEQGAIDRALQHGLRRYFPGVENEVRKLCFGIHS